MTNENPQTPEMDPDNKAILSAAQRYDLEQRLNRIMATGNYKTKTEGLIALRRELMSDKVIEEVRDDRLKIMTALERDILAEEASKAPQGIDGLESIGSSISLADSLRVAAQEGFDAGGEEDPYEAAERVTRQPGKGFDGVQMRNGQGAVILPGGEMVDLHDWAKQLDKEIHEAEDTTHKEYDTRAVAEAQTEVPDAPNWNDLQELISEGIADESIRLFFQMSMKNAHTFGELYEIMTTNKVDGRSIYEMMVSSSGEDMRKQEILAKIIEIAHVNPDQAIAH